MFPAFLSLASRRVVVVGGGPVAAAKLDALIAAGADVTVVAPDVVPTIEERPVTILRRPFEERDLDGAWWVVAAAPADAVTPRAMKDSSKTIFGNLNTPQCSRERGFQGRRARA